MKEFNNFILSTSRNGWIHYKTMQVYVRKAKRIYGGEVVDFIELANFNIPLEQNKRKGTFTKFINECIKMDVDISIENIMNPVFIPLLERLGFVKYYGEYYGTYIRLKSFT